MFGHQRVGDLIWAAGDIQAKGFLLGATSGRTTLNGEGLQHQDGHSHILAGTVPNQRSYDPTYSYEVAVIVQHGLKEMYDENQSVFYYITLMNENYSHPDMPEGAETGIIKGMYLLKPATSKMKHTVRLLGSGTILREVEAASEMLADFEWRPRFIVRLVSMSCVVMVSRQHGITFCIRKRKRHVLVMSRRCLVVRMLPSLPRPIISNCIRSKFVRSLAGLPTSRWGQTGLAVRIRERNYVSILRWIVDLSP